MTVFTKYALGRRSTPATFTESGAVLSIFAVFNGGTECEQVYTQGLFHHKYATGSTTDGTNWSIVRKGGWPSDLVLGVDTSSGVVAVLAGLQVTELATTPGLGDGEVRHCNGYATDGDGGDGLFSWAAGVSSGADGYTKINAAGGQWRRIVTSPVKPEWFGAKGDGTTVDTAAIQLALDYGAGKRVVFDRPVKYITGKLTPPPGSDLYFCPGCVLESNVALLGNSAVVTVPMFHITGSGNFKISGYGATLQMNQTGFSSEYNHCVYVQAHTGNVMMEGIACNSSGGDGILVKSDNSNVSMRDVSCHGNRRNGLAIGRCKSFEAYGCTFSGTQTHVVKAGVDIEPDNPTDVLGPIRFYGCKFKDNCGNGLLIFLSAWQDISNTADIEFHGCTSEGNGLDTTGTGAGFDVSRIADVGGITPCRGHIRFVSCVAKNENYAGFLVFNKSNSGPRVTIEGCTAIDCNKSGSTLEYQRNAFCIYNDGVYVDNPGGVTIIRPTAIQTENTGNRMTRLFYAISQGNGHDDIDVSDWTIVNESNFTGTLSWVGCSSAEKRVRLRHHSPREIAYNSSITSEIADGRHRADVISNRGATAIRARTLPSATADRVGQYTPTFLVISTFEVRVAPQAGDTILGGGRTAGVLIASSTPGSRLRLQCTAANEWTIVEQTGTWV